MGTLVIMCAVRVENLIINSCCCRKITQYSPSDTSKQYEKGATRKSTSKFNPKAILKRLKEEPEQQLEGEDLRPKIDLINQYLNVSVVLNVTSPPNELHLILL